MTAPDFLAAYRLFCRRRPFRPFLIELTSGDRVLVSHPESTALYGGLLVHTSPRQEYRLFPPAAVVQLLDPPSDS